MWSPAINTAVNTRRMPPVEAAITSVLAEAMLFASTVVRSVSVVDFSLAVIGLVVLVEFVVVAKKERVNK